MKAIGSSSLSRAKTKIGDSVAAVLWHIAFSLVVRKMERETLRLGDQHLTHSHKSSAWTDVVRRTRARKAELDRKNGKHL